jgi:regulator of protease activity HflC (stomatin/prohibitin superfamily)
MRSEVGKIPLDKTFEERESLNFKMVDVINEAALSWGIECIRYEIKDIKMPPEIQRAMELQMTAERQKRARILESEGKRQSEINDSEGKRQSQINIADGAQVERVQRAKAEAEAIALLSQASACAIERISIALQSVGGEQAAALHLGEKYIEAFRQLAKEGNTVVLPANLERPASMITEALTLYHQMQPKSFLSSHTSYQK